MNFLPQHSHATDSNLASQPNLANQIAQRCAVIGLSAFILLLPFARLSELGIVFCLISSGIYWAAGLLQKEKTPALQAAFVTSKRAAKAALACWAAIFAAELISCMDSAELKGSLVATFGGIRFAALIIAAAQLSGAQRVFLSKLAGITLGIWCVDALVQATSGFSLGGRGNADRISGVFGDDNLKLGLVTATLAPIALFVAQRFRPPWFSAKLRFVGLFAVWLIFAAVILLAGARAGWVMFALVSVLWGLQLGGYNLRKVGLGLLFGLSTAICLAVILNATNSRFAQRVERTMAIFDLQTADFALAGRVPIWKTAVSMAVAHPINGVGVRAFRYAYPEFAQAGDPWVHTIPAAGNADAQAIGANHPHQLLLEILTETGLIGLLLWAFAIFLLVRAWRRASPAQRAHAWPYGCALIVLSFPINTHSALYSSFWAGMLWWLMALLSANLDGADDAVL